MVRSRKIYEFYLFLPMVKILIGQGHVVYILLNSFFFVLDLEGKSIYPFYVTISIAHHFGVSKIGLSGLLVDLVERVFSSLVGPSGLQLSFSFVVL